MKISQLLAIPILIVLAVGCGKKEERNSSQEKGPKTFYGKSVEGARGVAGAVSGHDSEIAEQAKELEE